MNGETSLTGSGYAASAFVTLVTRWLVPFAYETADHGVDDARRWASNATAGTGKPTPSPAGSITGPPRVVVLGGENAAQAGPDGEGAPAGARAV